MYTTIGDNEKHVLVANNLIYEVLSTIKKQLRSNYHAGLDP